MCDIAYVHVSRTDSDFAFAAVDLHPFNCAIQALRMVLSSDAAQA